MTEACGKPTGCGWRWHVCDFPAGHEGKCRSRVYGCAGLPARPEHPCPVEDGEIRGVSTPENRRRRPEMAPTNLEATTEVKCG